MQLPGPARRLYGAGLALDGLAYLAGLAYWAAVLSTGADFDDPLPGGPGTALCLVVASLGVQRLSAVLKRRAWWHVPRRGRAPTPWAWVLTASTVAAVGGLAVVLVAVTAASEPLAAGTTVGAAVLLAAAAFERPQNHLEPEPAPAWAPRAVPLLAGSVLSTLIGLVSGVLPGLTVVPVIAIMAVGGWVTRRRRTAG